MAFTGGITGWRSNTAAQFRPTRIVLEPGTALTLETAVDTVVVPRSTRTGQWTSPIVTIAATTTSIEVLLDIDPTDYLDSSKLTHLHVERFESGSWVRKRSLTWSGGAFTSKAGVNAMPRKTLSGSEFAGYQIRLVGDATVSCNVGMAINEK